MATLLLKTNLAKDSPCSPVGPYKHPPLHKERYKNVNVLSPELYLLLLIIGLCANFHVNVVGQVWMRKDEPQLIECRSYHDISNMPAVSKANLIQCALPLLGKTKFVPDSLDISHKIHVCPIPGALMIRRTLYTKTLFVSNQATYSQPSQEPDLSNHVRPCHFRPHPIVSTHFGLRYSPASSVYVKMEKRGCISLCVLQFR